VDQRLPRPVSISIAEQIGWRLSVACFAPDKHVEVAGAQCRSWRWQAVVIFSGAHVSIPA